MIYLDTHINPFPCSTSLDWMGPYLKEPFQKNAALLASLELRAQLLYDLAGACKEDMFFFTSSGAEAVSQVLWSTFLEVARKQGKCHFVFSQLEEASTMQMAKRLEELGCFVKIAPLNSQGQIDLTALEKLLSPRTALLSVSAAQGLTGVIQPIEEIAHLAREKKALLHIDATYALGKYRFSFSELGADYLTFSGAFFHSLRNTGGLFAKRDVPLVPLFPEKEEDLASFFALAGAAQQAALSLDAMGLEVARLRDLFEQEICRLIPEAEIAFHASLRLPNTSAILFPRVHWEPLLYLLHRKKVFANGDLHRLLLASHYPEPRAETALSFSLSRMTAEADILFATQQIAEAVLALQKIGEDLFP